MQKWHRFLFFFLTLLLSGVLIWIVVTLSPLSSLSLQGVIIPTSSIFYILLFVFCLCMSMTLTKQSIHGVSCGILFVSLLLLKTNGLFQPFLILLLIILIISLEIAFWQRRKTSK